MATKSLALGCALLLSCFGATLGAEAPDFQLTLVDMQGNRQVLGTLPGSVFAPRLSPDGKLVVFELADPAPADQPPTRRLWVADLHKLEQRRSLPLVGGQQNIAAMWSPDGQRLVFMVTGSGRQDALYSRRADGTDDAIHLIDARAPEGIYPGNRLAFITLTGNRDYGISVMDLNTKVVTRLIDYPDSEQHSSRISPDGRWIAYASNETGRQEVWLEPLPQSGVRHRITQNGGRHPVWSPDGTKLYFDQGGQMFRLDLTLTANPIRFSEPNGLPIKGFQQIDLRRQFDLMPDGKQFLLMYPVP